MTRFQHDEFGRQRRVALSGAPTRNRIATRALVWAFLVFIPFAPLIGLGLGLVGVSASRHLPGHRGIKRSLAATMLGLLFTAGQTGLGYRGFQYWQTVQEAPHDALAAGFAGDVVAFGDRFDGDADFAAAAAFIEELEQRYGPFLRATPSVSLVLPNEVGAYHVQFVKGSVRAEAKVTFIRDLDPTWLESRLEYLAIRDDALGDLRFPDTERQRVAGHPAEE